MKDLMRRCDGLLAHIEEGMLANQRRRRLPDQLWCSIANLTDAVERHLGKVGKLKDPPATYGRAHEYVLDQLLDPLMAPARRLARLEAAISARRSPLTLDKPVTNPSEASRQRRALRLEAKWELAARKAKANPTVDNAREMQKAWNEFWICLREGSELPLEKAA